MTKQYITHLVDTLQEAQVWIDQMAKAGWLLWKLEFLDETHIFVGQWFIVMEREVDQ